MQAYSWMMKEAPLRLHALFEHVNFKVRVNNISTDNKIPYQINYILKSPSNC